MLPLASALILVVVIRFAPSLRRADGFHFGPALREGARTGPRALGLFAALLVASTARAVPPCEAPLPDGTPFGKACPLPINSESARGLALGAGLRASGISTSALAYNPAALALGRLYHIEGSVDYMADLKTVALGGAVVDSSTARLAAGLSFRGFLSGEGGLGGIDGKLGLAFPFSDAVSLGVSGRYLNVESEAGKSAGFARAQRLVKGFTMDASLRVAPIPQLQLDVAAYNFINRESLYAPIMVGGGASIAIGEIGMFGADMLVDLTSYDSADFLIGGGLELLAAQTVPLRAGYSYETQREQHMLTLGLGYTDRAVGFDLSLRQQLGGRGDTRIMGAFRIYVR